MPSPGVWLEVALNGAWGRGRQPLAPVTRAELVAEAIACADAGAAVVHLHAFDETTGLPREAYELYAPVFDAVRSARDVVLYPTVPMGPVPSADAPHARDRYDTVARLAAAGLIEWAVVDPGSVNVTTTAEVAAGTDGFLYANSASDVRTGLGLCAEHGLVPSYAVYEPGFLRAGALLRDRTTAAPRPVYRFMFSDSFTFGFPPAPWALDAHLRLLAEADPGSPWMVAGLGVELGGLWDTTLERGGHLRVGLEDAPLGCERTNAALVGAAVAGIERAGRHPATPAEVRAATTGAGSAA